MANSRDDTPIRIILAVDIGSSSIRCTAYWYWKNSEKMPPFGVNTVGCAASQKRQSVDPSSGKIRLYGCDDNKSLMEMVDDLVEQVLRKLQTKYEQYNIVAVGFSSFVMNLIGVDAESGTLLGETYTCSYACNAPEAVQECERLKQTLSKEELDELYQKTGAPLHTAYAIPQLLVMYKRHEEQKSKKRKQPGDKDEDDKKFPRIRWETLASHCIERWTGESDVPVSYSEASWTGLMNFDTCMPEDAARNLLPKPYTRTFCGGMFKDYTKYIEGIKKEKRDSSPNPFWERFPKLRDAKFFLGIGDGACATIGSKCTTSNRIAVTVGTSAAARMCIWRPRCTDRNEMPCYFSFQIPSHQGLFCYRIDKNHALIGGALTDGGSVIEWARNLLNLTNDENFGRTMEQVQELSKQELNNASSASSSDSETSANHRNLLMVPFLSGERSTGFRSSATGAMIGLTRQTTTATFLQSCFEGVAFRLKAILDLILQCKSSVPAIDTVTPVNYTLAIEDDTEIDMDHVEWMGEEFRNLPPEDAWNDALEIIKKSFGMDLPEDDMNEILEYLTNGENKRLFQHMTKFIEYPDREPIEGSEEAYREEKKKRLEIVKTNENGDELSIIASGKALEANEHWRQMIADTSSLRMVFDDDTEEATSRGVAQLVAIALQGYQVSMYAEEITSSETSEPRPAATALYQRKAQQQNNFIDSVSPLFATSTNEN